MGCEDVHYGSQIAEAPENLNYSLVGNISAVNWTKTFSDRSGVVLNDQWSPWEVLESFLRSWLSRLLAPDDFDYWSLTIDSVGPTQWLPPQLHNDLTWEPEYLQVACMLAVWEALQWKLLSFAHRRHVQTHLGLYAKVSRRMTTTHRNYAGIYSLLLYPVQF